MDLGYQVWLYHRLAFGVIVFALGVYVVVRVVVSIQEKRGKRKWEELQEQLRRTQGEEARRE
jgi:hypothetical protein